MNMECTIHPDYLREIQLTQEDLRKYFWQFTQDNNPRFEKITDFARFTMSNSRLGDLRVGFITILAQTLRDAISISSERIIYDPQHVFFQLALDLLNIAEPSAKTMGQKLQVAISYSIIGRQARENGIPELTLGCYIRAAETYVQFRKSSQVSDMYYNIALAKAALGYKGDALGWLNLSAEVSRSLNDSRGEMGAIELAGDIRTNFSKYCMALSRKSEDLKFIEKIHDAALSHNSESIENPQSFMMLTIIPQCCQVFSQGKIGKGALNWRTYSIISEYLESLYEKNWPTGVIAAEKVDLEIISRLYHSQELLDNLEPRALEVLVARLFEGFGAQVELTKETRDGGYDVGAIFFIGDIQYRVLIEAKRWKEGRKVGLEIVDRMLGVRYRMNADKAIIVTTSTFSNVARQTVAKLDMEIELVDRAGLNEWIKKYLIPADGSAITLPPISFEAEQQSNR